VDNYVRYRPAYPTAVVDTLIDKCCLDKNSVVADVGAGTGIFTQHLLDKHLQVVAIEPNQEMRQAAEKMLSGYAGFTSTDGSAEETNLADHSVDLIVAAQAFHWFRNNESQSEFARILKPSGWVALVWNQRKIQQPFQQDYDALLRQYAPEYSAANHMNIPDDAIAKFLAGEDYQTFCFENVQVLDKDGFLGRMQSSSYTPAIGTPGYPILLATAERLFASHAVQGRISFEYDTRLYIGKLSGNNLSVQS
jgi:ubiquinone/menaquinone biosynthesis C-methylase UbiE